MVKCIFPLKSEKSTFLAFIIFYYVKGVCVCEKVTRKKMPATVYYY